MNPFRWLRRRDDDLDEEIRGHLEQAKRDLMTDGMSPEEAEYAARRELGNLALVKEVTREMWGLGALERLGQDLRFGLRMLRRSPGFTATAVITLALGSGANTAVFSMLDVVLLKSLPVREPARLFLVEDPDAFKGDLFRRAFFEELRERNTVFEGVCLFSAGSLTWSGGALGTSEPLQALLASGDYHSVLGVEALLGRTLTSADELRPGGSPVAVISQGFWTRRFARSPTVVGQTLTLNGGLFTIVGVTPSEFFGVTPGQNPDVTVPHRSVATATPQYGHVGMGILGRLRGDVGVAQAQAGLSLLHQQRLTADAGAKLTPESQRGIARRRLVLEPAARGVSTLRRQLSKPLLALAYLVGLLLLIACANIANLLMARNSARQAEIAMRAALGASRARLLRQLLTEGLLLASLGGAAGLLLAAMASPLLRALASGGRLTLPVSAAPDARVLAFTLALSALVSLLFGAVPALGATRFDSTAALKHRHPAARGPARLGRPLLAAQVALALVLLVGAGLFLRSLQNLVRVDAGFDGERVLLFSVDPTLRGHSGERFDPAARAVLDAAGALPGVRSAAYSDMGLLGAGYSSGPVAVGEDAASVLVNRVSPRFFETLGMRLLLGRDFSPAEDASAPRVAIVNESWARRFFGSASPLGRTFHFTGSTRPIEIVGVARDAKYHDLRAAMEPTVFLPAFQDSRQRALTFALRAEADPRALVGSLRRRIAELDPGLMVYGVKTQSEQAGQSLAVDRLIAALSAFFGALALLLVCVGLFGVTAYNTARRTAEIGIRMALGARRSDVIRLVMRGALWPAAIGVVIGLGLALLASRLVAGLLFGLTPSDPATLALAILLMMAAAACAGFLPARRAARVDPQVALRCE